MSAVGLPIPIDCDGWDGNGCPDKARFTPAGGRSATDSRAEAWLKGWRPSSATWDVDYCPACVKRIDSWQHPDGCPPGCWAGPDAHPVRPVSDVPEES